MLPLALFLVSVIYRLYSYNIFGSDACMVHVGFYACCVLGITSSDVIDFDIEAG